MKKTHGAIVGVHTASATTEKRKWWILNPSPHRADFFFSKNGHAVYYWKPLEERNTFIQEP